MPKQLDETSETTKPISHWELMQKCEHFMKCFEKSVTDKVISWQAAQECTNTEETWRRALADAFFDLFFREQGGRPEEIADALGKRGEFADAYEIFARYVDLPPFPTAKLS